MSAKTMFMRMFRRTEKTDTNTWSIEVDATTPPIHTGDAATVPIHTWDATQSMKAIIEDEAPTIQMPPVRDDSADISVMRWQPTDEDVTSWARRNMKRLSPETIAAGLIAYVQQHPVAA